MTEERFELKVSVPQDSRFAETLRMLVVHAAQYAGCPPPNAEAFGRSVEEAVQDAFKTCPESRSHDGLDLVIRRNAGPVEVVVCGRTLTINP